MVPADTTAGARGGPPSDVEKRRPRISSCLETTVAGESTTNDATISPSVFFTLSCAITRSLAVPGGT